MAESSNHPPPEDSLAGTEYPEPTDSAVIRGEEGIQAGDRLSGPEPEATATLRRGSPDAVTEAMTSASGGDRWQEDLTIAPDSIPGYRIIRRVAVGGMGAVYEAEQINPLRRVALKVVRPGTAGRETMRRFEFEANVLARLNHPGIARIYGAGTWESALGPQPWFAMEFVEGEDLRSHVRSRNPGPEACLELAAQVAEAVEHAHQRGIIHRDLKPGNILVTSEGRPVILDFGLARMVDSDMQAVSMRTEVGQILGTLFYMSPEQTQGDPGLIDTRSDVFSLGVITHELLTGHHPQDLRGKAVHEVLRAIQVLEPASLNQSGGRFASDVQTIISKAMEKDKERRYASAGEFALDLRRYLADEPIIARPPSVAYQIARFARRNRALVGGACVALLALVAGLIGFAWQAGVAARERDQAREARTEAERHLHEARMAKLRIEDQQYLSNIQLAGVRLGSGLAGLSRELLSETAPRCRNWEWGYLLARTRELEGIGSGDAHRALSAGSAQAGEDAAALWRGISTPRMVPLTRGASGLAGLAVSQDGERIAGATREGQIIVIDRRSGRTLASMNSANPPLRGMFFGLYARTLLAFEEPASRIASWDTSSGDARQSFSETGFPFSRVVFSPDLVSIHAWTSDGRSAIVNATTGNKILDLQGEPVPLIGSGFSRDGSRLVGAAEDGSLITWSVEEGERLAVEAPVGEANPVAGAREAWFGPGLRRIVFRTSEGGLVLTDPATGGVVLELPPASVGQVEAPPVVRFSGDGSALLVIASDGNRIDVFDAADGSPVSELSGWGGEVMSAEFGPEAHYIAVGFADGRLGLLEPVSRGSGALPPRVARHSDIVYDLCFNATGDRLASASYDGTARVWDTGNRTELHVLRKHDAEVVEAMFSPDGRTIATIGWEGLAQFWNAETGEPTASRLVLPGPDVSATFTARNPIFRSLAGVQKFEWSPDGRNLIGPARDNTARIIRPDEDLFEIELKHPPQGLGKGGVITARFSPDGSRALTASLDRTARVWDARSGEHLLTLEGHRNFVGNAIFSPDGGRIGTMSMDRSARVWDARSGVELFSAARQNATVQAILFSPDSRLFLAGFSDSDAEIRDAASGEILAQLRGHTAGIILMRFSPDGRRIMTAAADQTVRIWDREGNEQITLESESLVACAEWSPGGRLIVAGTHDGALQFWEAADWK